ncbi:MAG: hypothetical protein JWR80_6806 [Bradyrhizobium sp.]|nr:hypothetical protein [Bradyrhizobium sp.]
MSIQADALLAHDFGVTRQRYEPRDAILYALGIGLGERPADLPYVFELGLEVFPTFAVTLASPGMWINDKRFGVDFARLVHVEQKAWFHAPLPTTGEAFSTARVISLHDRGADKGALLTLERDIADASGSLLCTVHQKLLLRGDGGFGGSPPGRTASFIPERPADLTVTGTTSPRAALIYRLSGDWNPLHVDPAAAVAAGFPRPILHGLASYGTACAMLCQALCIEPSAVTHFGCRFSGIVYPGDTLEVAIWNTTKGAVFRASTRGRCTLDQGVIETRSPK